MIEGRCHAAALLAAAAVAALLAACRPAVDPGFCERLSQEAPTVAGEHVLVLLQIRVRASGFETYLRDAVDIGTGLGDAAPADLRDPIRRLTGDLRAFQSQAQRVGFDASMVDQRAWSDRLSSPDHLAATVELVRWSDEHCGFPVAVRTEPLP